MKVAVFLHGTTIMHRSASTAKYPLFDTPMLHFRPPIPTVIVSGGGNGNDKTSEARAWKAIA
jgi:hypothetical protein